MKVKRKNVEFEVSDNPAYQSFWSIDGWGALEYDVIYNCAPKCEVFIDVGAWIGPMTLFAAKLYKKVYSFEPDPTAFSEVWNNIMLNEFTNVELTQMAVSGEKGKIQLGGNGSPLGQSVTSIFGDVEKFETGCDTLRSIFEAKSIPKHPFLKIDIEGGEWCLFDDIDLIRSYKPIILLECHPQMMPADKTAHLLKNLQDLSEVYKCAYMLNGQVSVIDLTMQNTINIGHLFLAPRL